MKTIKFIAIFTVFLLAGKTAIAANHYVRSGATGANNGNDWSNAFTSLPSTLVRGDTYYIASGSYSGRTFNTPASGTSVITIKGATNADHGTDAGWNNSYSVDVRDGGKQAVWTSSVTFSTSYWVFDGTAGPNWSKNPADYGFTFSSNIAYPVNVGANATNTTNFTISHIAATAPSTDQEKLFLRTGNTWGETDNVTLSHSYFSGWQSVWWATSPLSGTHYQDNWLAEYNMVLNTWGTATYHAEAFNNNYGIMNNLIVRYTWFEGTLASGITGYICANNADNINAKIYGNVFKDLTAGNGIITGTSAGNLVSPQVYNNTFINTTSAGWIGGNTTGTPLVYNNVLYNMNASRAVSTDYNAYFSTTNTPTEAHGQTGTGSPFANLSTGDLRLLAASQAGTTLASPYNIDAYGNTRGVDGTWDRGAFEYGTPLNSTQTVTTLSAPQNLRVQ